ncbi:VOC family protein [Vampirovibrio sp.]|uniref:VOC family protein n=1 Tax=Vampirovibrio sp. TaxID=2717857 RepID=UPI003594791F
MTSLAPIPPGFHSVTPHLVVYDGVAALDFYQRAFGAHKIHRLNAPDGKMIHAAFMIGDSMIMLAEEFREYGQFAPTSLGNSPVTIHLYVPNVDEAFERAVFAGATIEMPVQDMFWGDRYGKLVDPFGHHWSIATPVQKLSSDELQKAANSAMACHS